MSTFILRGCRGCGLASLLGLSICGKQDRGHFWGLPGGPWDPAPPAPASNNGPHSGPSARQQARDGPFPP